MSGNVWKQPCKGVNLWEFVLRDSPIRWDGDAKIIKIHHFFWVVFFGRFLGKKKGHRDI